MTGVWVYSTDFSLYGELLTKADELAEKLGAGTAALLIGRDVRENADSLARMADKVYLLDRPELGWFEAGVYAEIIYRLAQQHEPDLIIVDSSRRGKELSARLATKLKAGCIPDCLRLDVEQGRVVADRMVYGGRAISTQACKTPAVVAVAPHAFEEKKLRKAGELVEVDVDVPSPAVRLVETRTKEVSGAALEEAEIVIAGGRGIEKREDLKLLHELAEVLNGEVGCTRPLAEDRGWFTDWIGLSGHKIKPNLYIAVGISGAIQHVAGIRDAKIIVSINTDEEAPINQVSDYIINADLYEVVPALIDAIKRRLGR
ncbi:electron transfer flavoprotein subunit alpha/FixB family protein [Candidatus Bathyarchaeota archaeon]|nr:MAG: electron transfer flavoprotein subunit alpha/FixB family protein [Candidatus Bathyarchaeota archaeon]